MLSRRETTHTCTGNFQNLETHKGYLMLHHLFGATLQVDKLSQIINDVLLPSTSGWQQEDGNNGPVHEI